MIEDRGSAVRVRVHVQPRASRSEVAGVHGDALKVRLAAPPVDNAANDELVRLIAGLLHVARSRVRVIAGASSRRKVVEIEGASATDVQRVLEVR